MLDRILALVAPPLCIACGADAGRAAPLCGGCRGRMGAGRRIDIRSPAIAPGSPAVPCWTAFPYDGPAGALVRALKFGGRAALADLMAAQIAAAAPPGFLLGPFVPVPVHPLHRRRRGIDHTLALAERLAERARVALWPCLECTGDATPQVGRSRAERVHGPPGGVCARPEIALPQAILVDDVLTTGATLAACASALRAAGTEEIAAIAYARTTAR